MTRLRIVSVLSVLVLAFTASVEAQDQERRRGDRGDRGDRRGGDRGRFRGPGGMGRGVGATALLGSKQVREHLKITEEQGKKLEEIIAAHREASRGLFSRGPRDASDEERQKAREEAGKKREALAKETRGKIDGVLNDDQSKRLSQIEIQQAGTAVLVRKDIVASLKLSDEQVGKIKAAFEARNEKMGELFRAARDGGGREGMREKMSKIRDESDKAVLELLSKEQNEAFATMKGEEFELDRSSLFRGRGRGGRGGGEEGGGRRGGGQRRRPPSDDAI